MSAFFIWLEFSQRSINKNIAQLMFEQLRPYGGDSQELLLSDNVAIGSHLRWTTPEDIGSRQPFYNKQETDCFLFDGRIDNRAHLISELHVNDSMSDGELLHIFLARFGVGRLSEVIGPFVFVWFDFVTGRLRCARDAMGGRYLVYRQTSEYLLISSTETALMPHPDIGHSLNPTKIASRLANHPENQHTAYLEKLSILNPGQTIDWLEPSQKPGKERTFYRPNPRNRIKLGSDAEYAIEFRRLLDQAVQRRLRANGRVGSMLSGGLDSVPITVSAANLGKADNLIAYSWTFEETPESDERFYSSPLCQRLGLRQVCINCDDLWPKFDHDTHLNPLFPFALPYSEFQQQTFRRANSDNVKVMLSGLQGDLLYETSNRQVYGALSDVGIGAAYREFNYLRQRDQLSFWATVKRYLVFPLGWVQKLIERRRSANRPYFSWLTEEANQRLDHKQHCLFNSSLKALRPIQYRITLDGFAGEDAMLGRIMENKYEVERRYPFRDRDLCEYMLAIPTSQLAKLGVNRPIVKQAYADTLSDDLMARNDKTDFASTLYRGIHNDRNWTDFLNQTPSYWQKYVKECDLSYKKAEQDPYLVVLWQCAYYNFWCSVWYDAPSKISGYRKVNHSVEE